MKDKRTNKSKSLDIHMMVFDRVKMDEVSEERTSGWVVERIFKLDAVLAVHIAIPI